jgi:hypothetical protein
LYDEDAILDDMQENLVFEAGEKVDLTKRNKGKQQKKGEESEEEEEAEEGVRVSKKKSLTLNTIKVVASSTSFALPLLLSMRKAG